MDRSKIARSVAVAAFALLLAACSGGYQRGIFTGYVVDTAENEIASKVGKPDKVDKVDKDTVRWVYKKKTFDPDNMNKVDDETIVVLKKDAAGNWKGSDVLFL